MIIVETNLEVSVGRVLYVSEKSSLLLLIEGDDDRSKIDVHCIRFFEPDVDELARLAVLH